MYYPSDVLAIIQFPTGAVRILAEDMDDDVTLQMVFNRVAKIVAESEWLMTSVFYSPTLK